MIFTGGRDQPWINLPTVGSTRAGLLRFLFIQSSGSSNFFDFTGNFRNTSYHSSKQAENMIFLIESRLRLQLSSAQASGLILAPWMSPDMFLLAARASILNETHLIGYARSYVERKFGDSWLKHSEMHTEMHRRCSGAKAICK